MLLKSIIMLALTLSFTLSPGQQDKECQAVITGVKGEVLVRKAGTDNFKIITWGEQLYKGDMVKTLTGSEATIAFSDKGIVKIGEKGSITILGDQYTVSSSDGQVKKISSATMININALTSKKERVKDEGAVAELRSGESETPIDLTAPYNSVLKTTRPSFSWNAAKTYDNYILKLYNSSGLLWSIKVKGNSADYPSGEKELEYGQSYFWNVEGEDLIDSDKSGSNKFSILSFEKAGVVKQQEALIKNTFIDDSESSSYHSIMGAYYIEQGLLQDAIAEFNFISQINPEAPMPHEILGTLYSETGNKDKAIEELQKALALSKKDKE